MKDLVEMKLERVESKSGNSMVDVVEPPCSVMKMLATTITISLSNFSDQNEELCVPCVCLCSWVWVGFKRIYGCLSGF